jgi:hypothetical protein
MIDSYSYPKLAGLIAAATDCLKAIERKNEAEASRAEALTLTKAERFVLREVRDIYADEDDVKCNEIAAVIDGLLERTK